MNKTLTTLSLAIAFGLVAAGAASAANAPAGNPSETRCAALTAQFDAEVGSHANAKEIGRARSERAEGGDACKDGKPAIGVVKLTSALKDIGVTPVAHKS